MINGGLLSTDQVRLELSYVSSWQPSRWAVVESSKDMQRNLFLILGARMKAHRETKASIAFGFRLGVPVISVVRAVWESLARL